MMHGEKDIEIDMWGCCVSRDIFSFNHPGIRINNFFQECSPVVAFLDGKLPEVTIKELTKVSNRSPGYIRWFYADMNKTVLETLKNSTSEWIVVDARHFTYDIFKFDFRDGIVGYATQDFKEKSEVYLRRGLDFDLERIHMQDVDVKKYVKELAVFLKKRYGKKIIFIEAREAFESIDENGVISYNNPDLDVISLEESVNLEFIKQADCYYIKTPLNVIADYYHKWGKNSVHYVCEYYKYAYDAVLEILGNHDKIGKPDIQLKLDMMYMEIVNILSDIRQGKRLSIENTLKRVENLSSSGEKDKAFSILDPLIKREIPEAYGCFAHIYRDGKGVEQDLEKAAEWMRMAADKNLGWAKNELFDILWRINTPESLKEMISVATNHASSGDGDAMGRLGRAYRDGKGVEQDLEKAAEWMRMAADRVGWFKNELFDILWRINTPESLKEMISVATNHASRGDWNSMGRLGRAYRDGKGVEQDLEKAAEWMRMAADKNLGWAKNELFDILWRINTPESLKEMISVATNHASSGDGDAMGRLGRAYRDGKGVEQNLDTAIDWMRKAADKNVKWARYELFDMLWSRGKPYDLTEMRKIAEAGAENNDGPMIGRLGRMYRDGKGVEQDLDTAIGWMRKAADTTWWWGRDFSDLLLRSSKTEHYEEAFKTCSNLVKRNDAEAIGRLGRMYRDGKGVEQNLDTAIDWMRKAADKNVKWARYELFDMLWSRGKPYDLTEMRKIAEAGAENNDGPMIGRLGRMYRDGKGVEQDLDTAIDWMRRAAFMKVKWAEEERLAIKYKSFSNQKKNLVIFNAGHHSAIPLMIALRMSRHKGDYAVLLTIPREDMYTLSTNLCNNDIFDDVIIYKDDIAAKSHSDFDEQIAQYFDNILGPFKKQINNSICYVSVDQIDIFGAYLLKKNKSFFVNEMNSNQFISTWRSKSLFNLGKISKEFFKYQSELGVISGKNDNIIPIYFKGTSKYPIRLKHYGEFTCDYGKMLDFLSAEDKNSILFAFSMKNIEVKDVQLILFNRLTNILDNSTYTISEIPYIYQTLIDYFGDGKLKIITKQHPNDTIDISDKFKDTIALDRFFPIELLRLFNDLRIRKGIGLYTSASERTADIVEENISVGKIYLKICPFIHSLHTVLLITSELNVNAKTIFTGLTDSPSEELKFFEIFIKTLGLNSGIRVKPISSYNGDKNSILISKGYARDCDDTCLQIVLSAESKFSDKKYKSNIRVSTILKGVDEWFVSKNKNETNIVLSNSVLNINNQKKKIYLKSCGANLEISIINESTL